MTNADNQTHISEMTFEERVEQYFVDAFGEENVYRQLYLPDPRWFCDLVVDIGLAHLYIELESRASEIRGGISQALGYAGTDPDGIPVVITPKDHIDERKVAPLRQSTTVVIREFDEEAMEFVD